MSGSPFAAFPAGQPAHRPLPPGAPSPFAARLAMAGRPREPEREASARSAYGSLVSAACYLATRRGENPGPTTEAIQLLRQLSDAMLTSGLDLGGDPQSVENQIWVAAHHRWERQKAVEGAIHYVKAASEVRQVEKTRRRRSWWARWCDAWRGSPGMQSF